MRLSTLRADNFRRFDQLSLRLGPGLNFFAGPNAAGKTSLLEAIYTLTRGRSFRTHQLDQLAGSQQTAWTLHGQFVTDTEPVPAVNHVQAVQWDGRSLRARFNQRDSALWELVQQVPVQILDPEMHRIILEGPSRRRAFLDWGVFHVEHAFAPAWSRYRRALAQRNDALRKGLSDAVVAAWEPGLAESGEQVDDLRRLHLAEIEGLVPEALKLLVNEGDWQFSLQSGWSAGQPLAAIYRQQRGRDRHGRVTHAGPHRAELRIQVGGTRVNEHLSRGQQKLLVAGMVLAQSVAVARHRGRYPILLLDDFGAELAEAYQQGLLECLLDYPGQVLVTGFELPAQLRAARTNCTLFHVEQGRIFPLG